jgi:tRNA (guanine10-N2)-dimethyltransferase
MNLYTINYSRFLADLCKLEMRVLFDYSGEEKHFLSSRLIDPSRSPFIKERLSVIFEGDTLDSLVEQVSASGFSSDRFKVIYLKIEGWEDDYQERLRGGRELGTVIRGWADVKNPLVTFGVTCVSGKWIFGTYERNNYQWHRHDKKPHTYSSSLSFRVARALVNIGIGHDTTQTLIDPCCGVGTVVIEALSMGIDARGYDSNPPVAGRAKLNVSFFGYPDVITVGDMHEIKDHYDVGIIDIPYGLYQAITAGQQLEIIRTARRICGRLILVTLENMDAMIREAGFEILDEARVSKGQMVRRVCVCEAKGL